MLSTAKHLSLINIVMLSAAKHLSLINVAEILHFVQDDTTPLLPRVLPGHSGLEPESRSNIASLSYLDAGSGPA